MKTTPPPALPSSRIPKLWLLRALWVRPRLLWSVVLGAALWLLLDALTATGPALRLLLAWNAGVLTYLLLAFRMMLRSSHERMRIRALLQDDGRVAVLLLVVLSVLMSLGAIWALLAAAQGLPVAEKAGHIALAVLTIVSSWAFTHVMFALHYAHDYYLSTERGLPGGLTFPDAELTPAYLDFLYFSCVIGTSGQTADVSISSPAMRRVALWHCVLAFFFNTMVLALTINIASGLF